MASLSEIRDKEARLAALLAQARSLQSNTSAPTTIEEHRAKDAARKRTISAQSRALWIPPPADMARRTALEADPFAWLQWYLPDVFCDPFCQHHNEMILAIERAVLYAGDQAIAAPRGEGKSTVAECVALRNILRGRVKFVVLFAATASDAANSLGSIKQCLAKSERLRDDYPEVCIPIVDVDDTPNRAHSCLVYGEHFSYRHARFQWSGGEISMPDVPGSVSAGAIIATRGLDAAVRGLKKGSRRPELALIDDPDTENTARNPEQAKKLSVRIERAIAGLAPKGKRMSRVMLTTLQNRICASAQFTSPTIKPSWKGKRFSFLIRKPERMDLWDEYITLRQQALAEGDEFARNAHQFYLDHREAMEAGAEVANPHSYDGCELPDGSKLQVSAVQRYFDFVADNGEEAALSELQNDPPEESGPIESGITAYRVQRQVSGYPRKLVPPGCTIIVQGIDVRKVALHKVVRAWRPDATGYTIDYGVQEVHGTTVGSDDGVDVAIVRALQAVAEFMREEPYKTIDGQAVPISLTLVDAGWRTEAIYHACKELGLGWMPAMGFGRTAGCVQANFNPPTHTSRDRKAGGDGWFLSRRPGGVWLVCMDADRWKAWEHDRWMTPTDKPGTMFLFGESDGGKRLSFDENAHFSYAKHITSEVEIEEIYKGVLRRRWAAKSDTNHYLDASYMANVAAAMKGIKLLRSSQDGQQAAVAAKGGWFAAQNPKGRRT